MRVSVISPFFNEETILERSVLYTYQNLQRLDGDWEWVIVNDGSTDRSLEIAHALAAKLPRLRVVSYPVQRGRGRALREGIAAAKGDYVVTLEIDSSWADDIVLRLVDALARNPKNDVVIASPHADGGGFANVPWVRRFYSIVGNQIIRLAFTKKVTMNTGMTRAYRREVIQHLPLEEDGKEFHLEVLLKLLTLNRKVVEIPAVLEWKESKLLGPGQQRPKRHDVRGLIYTHMLFSVFANPIRYFWLSAIVCGVLGSAALAWAVYNFAHGLVGAHLALLAISLFVAGLSFFGFGIVTSQNRALERQIWLLHAELKRGRSFSTISTDHDRQPPS